MSRRIYLSYPGLRLFNLSPGQTRCNVGFVCRRGGFGCGRGLPGACTGFGEGVGGSESRSRRGWVAVCRRSLRRSATCVRLFSLPAGGGGEVGRVGRLPALTGVNAERRMKWARTCGMRKDREFGQKKERVGLKSGKGGSAVIRRLKPTAMKRNVEDTNAGVGCRP
jgi:hypothetical protein